MSDVRSRSYFLGLLPLPERQAFARALRTETVGGLVLLAAAVVALVWANSPWSGAYEEIRDVHFGIPALGLDLSVGHWTADCLLAVFFLVAGIELKGELVVGELRTPATAALPVIAAVCGMAVPAALYGVIASAGGGSLDGWAVPMATDIAFVLAVLAVLSTHLSAALRAFLLTLAVVDDLARAYDVGRGGDVQLLVRDQGYRARRHPPVDVRADLPHQMVRQLVGQFLGDLRRHSGVGDQHDPHHMRRSGRQEICHGLNPVGGGHARRFFARGPVVTPLYVAVERDRRLGARVPRSGRDGETGRRTDEWRGGRRGDALSHLQRTDADGPKGQSARSRREVRRSDETVSPANRACEPLRTGVWARLGQLEPSGWSTTLVQPSSRASKCW